MHKRLLQPLSEQKSRLWIHCNFSFLTRSVTRSVTIKCDVRHQLKPPDTWNVQKKNPKFVQKNLPSFMLSRSLSEQQTRVSETLYPAGCIPPICIILSEQISRLWIVTRSVTLGVNWNHQMLVNKDYNNCSSAATAGLHSRVGQTKKNHQPHHILCSTTTVYFTSLGTLWGTPWGVAGQSHAHTFGV